MHEYEKLASILWNMDPNRVFFNATRSKIGKNKDKPKFILGFVFSLRREQSRLFVIIFEITF